MLLCCLHVFFILSVFFSSGFSLFFSHLLLSRHLFLDFLPPKFIFSFYMLFAAKDLVTEHFKRLEERINEPMEVGESCQVLSFLMVFAFDALFLCLLSVLLISGIWFVLVQSTFTEDVFAKLFIFLRSLGQFLHQLL